MKEKEGGGLFEGIWPKRMCRGKKREAKDYVWGIRWGSVEALSLGFRWAVAPLDLRNVFVLVPSSPNCEAYSRVVPLGKVAE